MSDEIDLSGEQDATDRLSELDEIQMPDGEDADNERKTEFEGEETTEEFDTEEALQNL